MHGEMRDVREVDALGKCDTWQDMRIARASQKLMRDMVPERENIEFHLTQQEKIECNLYQSVTFGPYARYHNR